MIIETVKSHLLELFPEYAQVTEHVEETVALEEQPSPEAKKGKKEQLVTRPNGLKDCSYDACGYHLDLQLSTGQLLAATALLFKNGFFLETITGVDWIKEKQLEAVYDFSRYDFDLCRVVVRTRVPRENPVIPTITGIYSGASWHERETHDFFGIKFQGHPHLIPLLLPEDADFHPLLKDFKA
jgi:NADH-quinone oxidoreductase subunit C